MTSYVVISVSSGRGRERSSLQKIIVSGRPNCRVPTDHRLDPEICLPRCDQGSMKILFLSHNLAGKRRGRRRDLRNKGSAERPEVALGSRHRPLPPPTMAACSHDRYKIERKKSVKAMIITAMSPSGCAAVLAAGWNDGRP